MGRGVAVAMAELGLEQLRLSFATVVSTGRWVGTIESPTTTSLAQARWARCFLKQQGRSCCLKALCWRQRLSSARAHGWLKLRSVWLQARLK